jgi:translation initiation factor IF-3
MLQKETYYINTLNATLNCQKPGKYLEVGKLEYHQQQSKKYREEHKQLLNTKHKCQCGGKYSYANKHHHIRNKKHQNFINLKQLLSNHQAIINDIDKAIDDAKEFITSANKNMNIYLATNII